MYVNMRGAKQAFPLIQEIGEDTSANRKTMIVRPLSQIPEYKTCLLRPVEVLLFQVSKMIMVDKTNG